MELSSGNNMADPVKKRGYVNRNTLDEADKRAKRPKLQLK